MHLPTLPHHILQKVIQNRNHKHLLLFPHDVSIVQIRRLQEIHFVNRDLTALHFLFPFFFKSRYYGLHLFCCVLGAVLGISAVSATFSRVFPGFWAGFWVLFLGFLQFQLLFLGFSQAFGLGLGAVLEVLEITAPQVLPTVCAINLWLLNIMLI